MVIMAENPLSNLEGRRIILASNSPRRRELLAMLGIEFEVNVPADTDESFPPDMSPDRVSEYLARKKAAACSFAPGDVVITADTTVVVGNTILGKPDGPAEAKAMLRSLGDGTHSVYTGLAVSTGGNVESLTAATAVTFARLSEQEIDWYVERNRPFDKAGAYGIQEWIGCVGITRIDGSFYNVMGLPLQRLYTLLGRIPPLA